MDDALHIGGQGPHAEAIASDLVSRNAGASEQVPDRAQARMGLLGKIKNAVSSINLRAVGSAVARAARSGGAVTAGVGTALILLGGPVGWGIGAILLIAGGAAALAGAIGTGVVDYNQLRDEGYSKTEAILGAIGKGLAITLGHYCMGLGIGIMGVAAALGTGAAAIGQAVAGGVAGSVIGVLSRIADHIDHHKFVNGPDATYQQDADKVVMVNQDKTDEVDDPDPRLKELKFDFVKLPVGYVPLLNEHEASQFPNHPARSASRNANLTDHANFGHFAQPFFGPNPTSEDICRFAINEPHKIVTIAGGGPTLGVVDADASGRRASTDRTVDAIRGHLKSVYGSKAADEGITVLKDVLKRQDHITVADFMKAALTAGKSYTMDQASRLVGDRVPVRTLAQTDPKVLDQMQLICFHQQSLEHFGSMIEGKHLLNILQKYRNSDEPIRDPGIINYINKFYNAYVRAGAPMEINVSYGTRRNVAKLFDRTHQLKPDQSAKLVYDRIYKAMADESIVFNINNTVTMANV